MFLRSGRRLGAPLGRFQKRTRQFPANPLSNQWNLKTKENPEGGKTQLMATRHRSTSRKSSSSRSKSRRSGGSSRRRSSARSRRSASARSSHRSSSRSRRSPSSRGRKSSSRRKYSPSASKNVEREMHEFKRGRLKMGRSGKKVKSRKQAIAIGLSEARRQGKKVPKKSSSSSSHKKAA